MESLLDGVGMNHAGQSMVALLLVASAIPALQIVAQTILTNARHTHSLL